MSFMHKNNSMHKIEKAFSLDPPLVQIAVAQLREAIMWARFAPGMKLKVADLQARFGLSSSPLREALGRLVAEGLVVVEDRRGFRVAGVTPAEVEDVARMRILLEQEAMRASIEHGGDAWESDIVSAFHALRLVEERLADVAPSLDPNWSERHRAFHMALLSACRSPNLMRLCGDFFQRAERFRRISAATRKAPRRKNDEHAAIMRAALARDADGAAALIATHIGSTAKNVIAAIENAPAAARGKTSK